MEMNKFSRLLMFFGLLLSVFVSGVSAEEENADDVLALPVTVSAVTDKEEITIGDKLRYTVTIEAPEGLELELPEFGENLGGFAVNDFGKKDKAFFGKRKIEQWYELDTYVSGDYDIPPFVVKFMDTETELQESAESETVTVKVKSLLQEEGAQNDIYDIKGPRSAAFNWKFWLKVFGVLVICGLVYVVILLIRMKKEGKFMPPPLPAHVIAYEALDMLIARNLISEQMVKEYYSEISLIIRHYLEGRFKLRAPEMTTEEFLVSLRDSKVLTREQKDILKDFLVQCDLVKFAKYGPSKDEIDSIYSTARSLVDETREEEKPKEEEEYDL